MEHGPSFGQVLVIFSLALVVALAGTKMWLWYQTYVATSSDIQAELELIQSKSEGLAPMSEDEARALFEKLAQAGDAVANLQTRYQTIRGDDAALEENASALDSYLAESDKGNRVPWYLNPRLAGTVCTWKFSPILRLHPQEVPVVWTCRSSTGVLVAYATAIYRVDDGVFSDVVYATTLAGTELGGVDMFEPEHSTEEGPAD